MLAQCQTVRLVAPAALARPRAIMGGRKVALGQPRVQVSLNPSASRTPRDRNLAPITPRPRKSACSRPNSQERAPPLSPTPAFAG